MRNAAALRKLRSAATGTLIALTLCVAAPAGAVLIDWDQLTIDNLDEPGLNFTVNDVDGSGVGFTAQYSNNMFGQAGFPDIYSATDAPTGEIAGTLRFTNDRTNPIQRASVTLTFTEAVLLDTSVVSHSIILNMQEHSVVEAFDAMGNLVLASSYFTGTPGLTGLDPDGDAVYDTVGLGQQSFGEYGNVFLSYDSPVKSIRYSIFVSEIGQDEIRKGFASMGIGDIEFEVVPEPTTALLLGAGLLGLALRRRSSPVS
jgi:hypothetical protein